MEIGSIHLLILLVTAVFIGIADHDGIQYWRGKKELLDPKRLKFLYYAILLGLSMMILSGGLMAYEMLPLLVETPAFFIKMIMVGALIANSFVIKSLMHVATVSPFNLLTIIQKKKIFTSAMISGLSWIGAITIGMFFL